MGGGDELRALREKGGGKFEMLAQVKPNLSSWKPACYYVLRLATGQNLRVRENNSKGQGEKKQKKGKEPHSNLKSPNSAPRTNDDTDKRRSETPLGQRHYTAKLGTPKKKERGGEKGSLPLFLPDL